MALHCEDIIRRGIGRGMTEEEILDFAAEGKRLAKKAQAGGNAAVAGQEAAALAEDWSRRQALAILARKRAVELQAATRLSMYNHVMQNFEGMEWEGVSALMVGSRYSREGSRLSVDSMRTALAGRYLGGMITDLEAASPDYVRMLRDDSMSRQISEALWSLGRADDGPAWTGPPEAMAAAKVIHKWQEVARLDENAAGAWISRLPGYICRQSHDPARMRKAGEEAWKEFIEPRLDWSRTADGALEGADREAVDNFLHEVYTGLVTGLHHKFTSPANPLTSPSTTGSTAAKASHERVLHFSSGGGWFDYNSRFGKGTLAEALVAGLARSANDTALMRVFGPSPQANLQNLIGEVNAAFRSRGDYAAIDRGRALGRRLGNQMKELDGSLNIEGNPTLAAVGRCVRAVESMARLGSCLISGFSDIPLFAQEMKYQGRSWFRSMGEGLALFAKGRGSLEERRILSQCGVFFDSMTGNLISRFSGQELPGKMTSLMNVFFRVNGMSFWTDAWKKSACLMMAHDLAGLADQTFDRLPAARRRMLSLYKIDAEIWDMLRASPMSAADGRSYLTPEAAAAIPRSRLEAYMTGRGMLASAERVEVFREELADRLRACFRDRVQYAVLEPDARTAAVIHQGQAAGTVTGEALRFVMQFKSFPVVFLQRALGREIYGRGAESALAGVAGSLVPHGGELGGLAGMILATTAFGYLSMTCKAMLAGKTARDFTESPEQFGKTFLAALVQGGGMGLYGDFLFGEKSRMGDDFLSSLAGPALGSASSLVSLYKSMRDGEDVRATAFRTFWSHIPGNNLFWTRTALDHLLLHSMYEWMNPGYLRRLRRRVERETNQEFWCEPTVWDWARR